MRNTPDINSDLHMHIACMYTHILSHTNIHTYMCTRIQNIRAHAKKKKRDRDSKWPCPTRYRSHSLTGQICMLKLKPSQPTQFCHHQVLFPPEQVQALLLTGLWPLTSFPVLSWQTIMYMHFLG